jgi:hypothetical protein
MLSVDVHESIAGAVVSRKSHVIARACLPTYNA